MVKLQRSRTPDYKTAGDEWLMSRLTKKDRVAAFEILFNRYRQPMFDYMVFMLYGDRDKAQDFVQELFLKIIEKSALFDLTMKFKPWIYTLARNMCKNERRDQGNRQRLQQLFLTPTEPRFVPDASEHISGVLLWEQILSAAGQWDEITKTTFLLRYQQQLPVAQIAEIMECPPGTVKSRLHALTKKLTRQFNPQAVDESESTDASL